MKKRLFILLVFQFFLFSSFAQNPSEETNQVQKFIEATVQIPFMARVADVQGVVKVRILMNKDSLPQKYEIAQSLRPDCDNEALRVVKSLNIRNLRNILSGKKKILFEVPFYNPKKILFEKNYVLEYFNKNKIPLKLGEKEKFARRYSVDTLTGILKSNVDYFDVRNEKPEGLGFALMRIDSTERYVPDFLDNQADSLRKIRIFAISNGAYPNLNFEIYENGVVSTIVIENKIFSYYPSGRIESVSKKIETESEKKVAKTHWFPNGQIAYENISSLNSSGNTLKFISVWDTLGKQLVKDGNGFDEYLEGNKAHFSIHKGLIKDGFKVGKWTAINSKNELEYVEFYDNGKCVKGVSYFNGDSISYKNPEENAEFKGGLDGFATHLRNNLKYPSAAQRSNISGKVYVQFMVCTDGTLCDFKVLNGVGYGCDEESLRVLKLSSGKWKSGKQRGRAVRSKFTVPINYVLSQ